MGFGTTLRVCKGKHGLWDDREPGTVLHLCECGKAIIGLWHDNGNVQRPRPSMVPKPMSRVGQFRGKTS
eukprot:1147627-Pelagomonas_calceolata.AAC.3